MNREQWLQNCAEALAPSLEQIAGKAMPNFQISMGFPSRNAISTKKRRIGECWSRAVSVDGVYQVFISPMIAEPMEVAATVAHELGHVMVGTEAGHRKPFTNVIRPLGLVGRATATEAGETFKALAQPILDTLGAYPFKGMRVNPERRATVSPLVRVVCPEPDCELKIRMTRVWLNDPEYGPCFCPKHQVAMVVK